MDRLRFLKTTAKAGLLLNGFSSLNVFAGAWPFQPPLNSIGLTAVDLEKISPVLQQKVDTLFSNLISNRWLAYAQTLDPGVADKFDIRQLILKMSNKNLTALKKITGFEDFNGDKWVEPGYPAKSLLYHMLANPRVRPDENKSKIRYPDLDEIDLLEDYIFGLQKWDKYKHDYQIASSDTIVLAVFAYEYRTAYKTPHHVCADLVFSRTGIGRIGNKSIRYDSINRCYTNNPTGNSDDKNAAVTPARFGLFAAVRKKLDMAHPRFSFMKMHQAKKDDINFIDPETDFDFLIPVRKIFNNDLLIGSAKLVFSEHHESRKIAILTGDDAHLKTSASLVRSGLANSSFLLSSAPADLIRPLKDANDKLVLFEAPKWRGGNRYYSTYYNTDISSVSEFIEVYDNAENIRIANYYSAKRNGPMYVNLTHDNVNNVPVPLDRNPSGNPSFEDKISEGRPVCLFEDNICDGYVSAAVQIPAGNVLKLAADAGVLKAFSIITALDFFPQVDEFDLQRFDIAPGSGTGTLFYEGGVASLANIAIPPSPIVTDGDTDSNFNPLYTYTTVISNYEAPETNNFDRPDDVKGYFFSSYLPDMCSGVFSPGWDITYSNNGTRRGPIFLSTQGLGSPFVEDMKLCAAMNGMWPAASPDASRTYQASVTDIGNYKRNPTAVPLMDDETGIHQLAAAHADHSQPVSFGWDGEQGPFIERVIGKDSTGPLRWHINFTDLGRADYIENTLHGLLDLSKLRNLDSRELNLRMKCLQRCLQRLGATGYPNASNDVWLVSAQKVNWDITVTALGIPNHLLDDNTNWLTNALGNIIGEGYIYVFAAYTPDVNRNVYWVANGNNTKRRRVLCNKLYVCRVTERAISCYDINTTVNNNTYQASNWK